jgi:hypothetical protein
MRAPIGHADRGVAHRGAATKWEKREKVGAKLLCNSFAFRTL